MMETFVPNIKLPSSYMNALIQIGLDNNMTAEQVVKSLVCESLENNHTKYLTSDKSSV
jgi:hypothetical protein